MLKLTKYDDLDRIVKVFAAGGCNLLVLLGRPGLAKSRTVRASLEGREDRCLWLRNNVSAFRLFQDLYANQDRELLVVDDVDSFYHDKGLVRLLKCLCETEDVKHLAWHTDAAKLDREGIPREFGVAMRTCIIANEFRALDRNVDAIEDRGVVVEFDPDAREVHGRATAWFDDQEILGFVEERLGLLNGRLTLRDYKRMAEFKAAGLDWRRFFVEDKGIANEDHVAVLAGLLQLPFETDQERVREYVRLTGRSRASYYRHKRVMAAA